MKMFASMLVTAAMLAAPTAMARETEPAKVTPTGEKIICKRTEETGSLVKATKRCYTREQWDRIAEAARGNATRMMSDHASGITTN